MADPCPAGERERRIVAAALRCGFDAAGIAGVRLEDEAPRLKRWIERGYAGQMTWLERNQPVRVDLRERFDWARSTVVVLQRYATGESPVEPSGLSPYVSAYAHGADYHHVLLNRLRELARRMGEDLGHGDLRWHAYVDTGPVLERQLARSAGLGWLGKNGLLLDARHGSFFFLGVLITDLVLEPSRPVQTSCGRCQACQPACPTDAFVAPGLLDARRCISYLTIEHRGPIDRRLRPAIGQWLFGCDLCQTACPFNYGRAPVGAAEFELGEVVGGITLTELLELDEQAFRARFRHSPLWRPGREGLLRNALIVVANGSHRQCLPAARRLLRDRSPVLRETASWCVAQSEDVAGCSALQRAFEEEGVDWVREAMEDDLGRLSLLGPGTP